MFIQNRTDIVDLSQGYMAGGAGYVLSKVATFSAFKKKLAFKVSYNSSKQTYN